jgi:hypothetical protein
VFLCRKVLTLMHQPPAPVVPEIVEPWPDNDVEEPPPAPPPIVPAPLPEAPASCNVYLTISGHKVQVTLRDGDEHRMLARLQILLDQYPVPAPQAASQGQLSPQQHNALAMHQAVTGWCKVHNVQMKQTTKDGRSWYSHRTDQGWCKGR